MTSTPSASGRAVLIAALLVSTGCGSDPAPAGPAPGGGGSTAAGRGGSGPAASGGAGGSAPTAGSGGTGGSSSPGPTDGAASETTTAPADGGPTDLPPELAGDRPPDVAGDAPPRPAMLIRHDIRPRDTDPAIDKWPEDHVAVMDGRQPAQNKLFLFLAGGNGTPSGTVDMLNEAASYGFHAIGIRFANTELVGDACPSDPDPACAGKMRTEVIEGEDLSRHLDVSRANSIENRLGKALAYLHQRWPNEGWGQYVDGTTARWDLVIAAGRSLGGAIAARIAQLRTVHRAEIHSAPGDSLPNGQPAPWLREMGKTPVDRIFAFSHTGDPAYRSFVQNWAALQIPGPPTSVDGAQPPYGNSHQLITSAAPPGGSRGAHGATTAGGGSPRAGGAYRYAPVWRYMMGVAP